MDLRQLRYFLQIADSGSLSRAAEVLHVAQPSLSQHIRTLEDELGVELLTRHPRGVTTTEYGRILSEHARAILREVERSREALASAAASPGGEVVVGLPTSACRGLAAPLIREAALLYPRIAIHIVEAMTGSLDEWVQTGRIDVALLYDRRAFENVVANDVMVEELQLIVPPNHALAGLGCVTFRQAGAVKLVLPARPHIIREVVETFAARADTGLQIAINCDSLQAIMALVRDGYATLYPSFALRDEIARGEMAAIPIVDPTPKWRLSIVLSRKVANLRAVTAVAGLLDAVARSLVIEGQWDAQLRRGPALDAIIDNRPGIL